jgi:hypothetical protein
MNLRRLKEKKQKKNENKKNEYFLRIIKQSKYIKIVNRYNIKIK